MFLNGDSLVVKFGSISDTTTQGNQHLQGAIAIYNEELASFKTLAKSQDVLTKKKAKGRITFLTYLQSYLKIQDMWRSWSVAGVMEAAMYPSPKLLLLQITSSLSIVA